MLNCLCTNRLDQNQAKISLCRARKHALGLDVLKSMLGPIKRQVACARMLTKMSQAMGPAPIGQVVLNLALPDIPLQ